LCTKDAMSCTKVVVIEPHRCVYCPSWQSQQPCPCRC
jgi:hypothetical protein